MSRHLKAICKWTPREEYHQLKCPLADHQYDHVFLKLQIINFPPKYMDLGVKLETQ